MSLFIGSKEFLPLGKLPFKLELALSFQHWTAIKVVLILLGLVSGFLWGSAIVSVYTGFPMLFIGIYATPSTALSLLVLCLLLAASIAGAGVLNDVLTDIKNGIYRQYVVSSDDYSFGAVLTPAIQQRIKTGSIDQKEIANVFANWEVVTADQLIRKANSSPLQVTSANKARLDIIALILSNLGSHNLADRAHLSELAAEAHEDQERNNDILRKELVRGEAVAQIQPSI